MIDRIITIDDRTAFDTGPHARGERGCSRWSTSGDAAAAALEVARRLGPGRTIVTIFPDGAERYPHQGILGT